MPAVLDREGQFRVNIESYGLEKAKDSGAHAVVLKCIVLEQYNFETQEWDDWRQFDAHEVWARVWIIKKDNSVNKSACESLIKHAGWDGDVMSIQNKTWQPTQCSVSVEENIYNGKTSFRVGFVNGWDDAPTGKLGNVDEAGAKMLAQQFCSSLRAVAGSLKQNSAKPNGKPSAPPKSKTPAPVGAPSEALPEDEIPF